MKIPTRAMNSAALILWFLCVIKADVDVNKWFTGLADPKMECSSLSKMPGCDVVSNDSNEEEPIFAIVKNCKGDGVRWDYNFKTKMKTKGLNDIFEGKGRLEFARFIDGETLPEHNNFKFGLKYNKCIKLNNNIKRIYGYFVSDSLIGPVKIEYHDGSFLVAEAKDSKLIGTARYFNAQGNLAKIAFYGKNSAAKIELTKLKYGIFRIKRNQRDFYTRDFKEVFICRQEDENLLDECSVSDVAINLMECGMIVDVEASSEDLQRQKFRWNLRTNEKFYEKRDDAIMSSDWSTKDIPAQVKNWLTKMESQDALWQESTDQPFKDLENPEISYEVSEYLRRNISVEDVNVMLPFNDNLKAIPEILASGKWNNGRVTIQMSPSSASDQKWRRMLLFNGKIKTKGALVSYLTLDFAMLARLRKGRPHGIIRRYGRLVTDPRHVCHNKLFKGLSFIGRYQDGQAVGFAWRIVIGGGFIYGRVDGMGQLTGDDIAYVYPDVKTALVGKFKNGIMVEAKEAKVVGTRSSSGMMELKFSEPQDPLFTHSTIPNNLTFGDQPLLTDPLDSKYVQVDSSNINHKLADEGAFAITNIPKDTPIALYSGLHLTEEQLRIFKAASLLGRETYTRDDDEKYVPTKYLGKVSECDLTINIPWQRGSLSDYRATLGHKLNHSFKPNCEPSHLLDSPRFGLVRVFFTARDITKGEELFINYGYSAENGPKWYRELYSHTMATMGKDGFDPIVLANIIRRGELEQNQNTEETEKSV